eukprot:s618_g18.t1
MLETTYGLSRTILTGQTAHRDRVILVHHKRRQSAERVIPVVLQARGDLLRVESRAVGDLFDDESDESDIPEAVKASSSGETVLEDPYTEMMTAVAGAPSRFSRLLLTFLRFQYTFISIRKCFSKTSLIVTLIDGFRFPNFQKNLFVSFSNFLQRDVFVVIFGEPRLPQSSHAAVHGSREQALTFSHFATSNGSLGRGSQRTSSRMLRKRAPWRQSETAPWCFGPAEDKNSAKYYFPTPEEKRKARIDVYQLVGTCSVPIDPSAVSDSNDVSVISSDPKSAGMKLKVSTTNKDVKPAEVAKHRQDIEAEAKDGAVGYLAKHGIEQLLSDSLKTMLRMKPEDPIEFMCKYLKAEGKTREAEPKPVATVAAMAPVAAEPCTAPFALRPSVGTWYMPLKTPITVPAAPAAEPAATAAPVAAPAPTPVAAAVAPLPGPPFALRPSVGTWYTPLQDEASDGLWNASKVLSIKGLGHSAHEYVPEFNNRAVDYKEYKKRILIYEKKMQLANRATETAFNVMSALTGRAWDAVEDIPMEQLESEQGTTVLLQRLDTVFKYDAITELPADFEAFFMHTRRARNQTIQEYTADFERSLRKLEAHNVKLPDKVIGWFYLRRAGLRQDQRQMVMTGLTVDKMSLSDVRKALNFVIGQDNMPEQGTPSPTRSKAKDSIYYEDEDWPYSPEYDEDVNYDEELDEHYPADGFEDGAYYEEEEEGEAAVYAADDAAAEYDEVFAAYVNARARMNQMRLSRGFYPVVAMVSHQQHHGAKGSKGKKTAKGLKGKGKNVSKQAPRPPPNPRARGKAALGAVKCLRCGVAGHYAKNCPQQSSAKRKADGPADADVMMVSETDEIEPINMHEDDGEESEADDTAIWDCGAASVLVSRIHLRKYLRKLLMVGYDIHSIKAWTCTKGFRFGNGNKDRTSICVLLPTWFQGMRRDILVYVINGKVPFLLGRPLMEKLQVAINYADKLIKWGPGDWMPAPLGPKGEYVLQLAGDALALLDDEVKQTLVPDDFYDHVQTEQEHYIMDMIQDEPNILNYDIIDQALETSTTRDQTSPSGESADATDYNDLQQKKDDVPPILVNSEGVPTIPFHDGGISPMVPEQVDKIRKRLGTMSVLNKFKTLEPTMEDKVKEFDLETSSPECEKCEQEVTDESWSPTSDSQPPKKIKDDEGACNLKRLTGNKLRMMMGQAEQSIKENEKIFAAAVTEERPGRKVKIWEVFAGKGRLTQILKDKYPSVKAERFSLEEGWDFSDAKHRKAFIRKLMTEEPDSVMLSPVCKLWSMLQELNIAKYDDYKEELDQQRQVDHDTMLTFVAIVYEIQRRAGRDATVEHPWRARSWSTPAFESMIGYDAYVDQCCYKLMLPDTDGVMKRVRKPTCFRTTGHIIYSLLTKQCPGGHPHTPLEGYIPGVGHRSKLAESYPPLLAAKLAEALVTQISHWDDVHAAESLEEFYNKSEIVDSDGGHKSPEVHVPEPVQKNRELRRQVGNRPFEYVQRLHKNLGHVSSETLCRMLEEIQATDDVMTAAKHYVCPACYARKRPSQAPPSSGVKTTEFNERIQVDSHWIQCEDSAVAQKEPAPGTPAAARKKREISGRQCVLTIVDHATRFCAVRILRGETAEEFTKGIERMWFKHFGLPKHLRIDEAKGWASKHVREWASSRAINLEVQPAEQHTWLGVVERKHQVIRRALELYQDDLGRHDLSALKEAAIYVPHAINQTAMVKGFTPQQWVLGKSMTHVHGLTSEIFNPGQEPLDEAGAFSQIQKRRQAAQIAWIKADSDAKLRRAFNQKFQDVTEQLVVGQRCWFWRIAGSGILQKAKWRGPARVVAIEDHDGTRVLWLCHGTSLVRCGERQVRPLVEESGFLQVADPKAALKDLEMLKARSTTQFKDELQADIEPNLEDNLEEPPFADNIDDYIEPSLANSEDLAERDNLPGIVNMVLPIPLRNDLAERDRERTPRREGHGRMASIATTNEPEAPPDEMMDDPAKSKRKPSTADLQDDAKVPRTKSPSSAAAASSSTPAVADIANQQSQAAGVPVPDDGDDSLSVEVDIEKVVGKLPGGWRCIEGGFELDDAYYVAYRKGEVNPRKLNLEEQEKFIDGKKAELSQYFSNLVWEFATPDEGLRAERRGRAITARWVLTWKKIEQEDGPVRWKAKARLVLRGFEDPDVLTLDKAAPTASRLARQTLLALAGWMKWIIFCGDVRAAFLSGKNFTRELIVKLPNDCAALLGVVPPCYMKMLKSAYGLSDAPLLWYEEADSRLQRGGWKRHALDKCCYYLVDKANPDMILGILILHVDDLLIAGQADHPQFQEAIAELKKNFQFGKWEQLADGAPIKYCGGVIELKDGYVQTSYEDYINKICPMTVRKGRPVEEVLTDQEKSKARGLIGALQWPAGQGVPALAASVSIQAGDLAGGDGRVLTELNKTLRFAKSVAGNKMRFLAAPEGNAVVNISDLAIVMYVDAAFDVRRDHSSQGGYIIVVGHKSVLQGNKVPTSTVSWRSFKLARVCRSSLAAECQALSTGLDELLLVKNFITHLQYPNLSLKEVQKAAVGNCAVVTDCKSLYDGLKRENIQQAADKRVALECLVAKELISTMQCQTRWISSERQLADGLTKVGARQNFSERYKGGYVVLVADETYTAAKRKTKEQRERTLQETMGSRSTAAQALVALVMNENIKVMSATDAGDNMSYQNDTITEYVMTVETEETYGMTSRDWMILLTLVVTIATTIFWFSKFLLIVKKHAADKLMQLFYKIKFLFMLKKIPQRKFERRINELEKLVSQQCDEIEKIKLDLIEKTQMASNLNDDLQHAMQTIGQMQGAINQYHQERNNLQFRILQFEANRHDVYVTKTGSSWHLRPDCHFLQSAHSTRVLTACSGCTGRGVYLTENGDIALLLNADKHLQILVKKSAKAAAQKIDTVVSALQGGLSQDGYVLSP